ncbi:MAG: hypothetical protein KF900_09010 [Bacteroidetes bacterium]|nr:hypothetical protein [Bacteroidota bacterium]
MKSKIILAATVAAVVLSSCATSFGIQKRRYSKGYHVSVTHKNKVENKHGQTKNTVAHTENETVKTEIVNAAPEVKTVNHVEFAQVASQNTNPQTSTKQQENNVVTASVKQNVVTAKQVDFKPVVMAKKQAQATGSGGGTNIVVLVILSIFPILALIAVWLHDSKAITLNFWITLILHFVALYWLFALLVVLDIINLDK